MLAPNHALENVFGTIGAVLWTIQIIPQIIKSYREKSTHGLSAGLMGIWSITCPPFASYIVAQNLSIPLQIQPHAFGFLCTVSWAQCLYYNNGYSLRKVILMFVVFITFWGGFEAGSIFALRAGERNGTEAPLLFYGYLSSVLLAVALLPQYWEIYKLKEVIGISMLFMAVDIAGGIFSFVSLFYRDKFDVAAFVSYTLVVVLDGIVVILAFVLNPIAKKRRAREAAMNGGDPELAGKSDPTTSTAFHTPEEQTTHEKSNGADGTNTSRPASVSDSPIADMHAPLSTHHNNNVKN